MKKLRSENGAITMLVLITVIFLVSFLISSYILVANKAKAQKEIIEETRKIYEPTSTMEEIYNSYFNNGNIIPIYTVEQLQAIGNGKQININGKYYTFSNDENTIYVLMNNLEIKAYEDYGEDYYWTPIGERDDLLANFEGNNNKIDVVYKDKTKTYLKENEFSEYFVLGINPTPADAIVTINGKETKSISVKQGEEVEWKVEKTGYVTQGGKHIADNDGIYDIILEVAKHTFTINPTPADAIVTINGQQTKSITVDYGTEISYSVSCNGYYTQTGSTVLVSDDTINVILAESGYIPFTEKFYFTRCSDEAFNGLLNGGSTTFEKYNLTGKDYSMGSFYVDEADIVDKVPTTSTIFKVTVYFDYYQDRDNTFLYDNRIKTTIYVGDTEKMEKTESEKTNKTIKTAKYELTNITREELANSLRVDFLNYIEGTLKIHSTIENFYCVIEGEYPDI